MIPVKVKEIVMDQSHHPLLLLEDLDEERVLPLGVGLGEAQAIAIKLRGESTSRPLTHDLMNNLCRELDIELKRIEIYDVYEETFYAHIFMEKNGEELVVDARPSDAVALALTSGASIFLSDKVNHYSVSVQDLIIEDDEDGEGGEEGEEGEEGEGRTRLH